MLDTWHVPDLKVVILNAQRPSSVLTGKCATSHQPHEWGVIRDDSESHAREVVAVRLESPHYRHHLTMVTSVVPLTLVERSATAGYHVLLSTRVRLSQDTTYPKTGPVCMHHDGEARVKAFERRTLPCQLSLEQVKSILTLLVP